MKYEPNQVVTYDMDGWKKLKESFIKPTFKSNLKPLTKEQFAEFQKIVNQHSPYCSADFEKHHFIENIASSPVEVAICRARGEYFIKCY